MQTSSPPRFFMSAGQANHGFSIESTICRLQCELRTSPNQFQLTLRGSNT
jgi:hypothetical protein